MVSAPHSGGKDAAESAPYWRASHFDDLLIAGEEPDFSARLRRKGWIIWRIAAAMTLHDLNMTTFAQYWKRAYRSSCLRRGGVAPREFS